MQTNNQIFPDYNISVDYTVRFAIVTGKKLSSNFMTLNVIVEISCKYRDKKCYFRRLATIFHPNPSSNFNAKERQTFP